MEKKITPQAANTFSKIFALQMDNVSTRNSWMMVRENHLTIVNQRNGENKTGEVKLTKKEFERFIKFYQTGK